MPISKSCKSESELRQIYFNAKLLSSLGLSTTSIYFNRTSYIIKMKGEIYWQASMLTSVQLTSRAGIPSVGPTPH